MKVAVIGATGMVGKIMLDVLAEKLFSVSQLLVVASAKSIGKEINFNGNKHTVIGIDEALAMEPDIALFSAGGSTSKEWAPKFASTGCVVIDNSSAWRMAEDKKLVVPEINADSIGDDDRIIANPNCSTIQLVMVLAPLHKKYGIKRLVISTYQSVTGTGVAAAKQLDDERNNIKGEKVYPHPIDKNCIPHCDVFDDEGNSKEETKLINETKKILGDDSILITATAVRVPVVGGHSESVNIEFREEVNIEEVRKLLSDTDGVVVQDDPQNNLYPMPVNAQGKDDVFVGRIRKDNSQPNTINLWIVADNLRKGAATNAVQIAEYVVEKGYAGKKIGA